jgi:hypothetical protein
MTTRHRALRCAAATGKPICCGRSAQQKSAARDCRRVHLERRDSEVARESCQKDLGWLDVKPNAYLIVGPRRRCRGRGKRA